ncbi:hypothetical protein SDJN02_10628 [Cucurbita argyrosperma subsp. argyrosperma]
MDLTPTENSPARPRRRTPRFLRSPGARRFNFGVPMTPLLRWKLDDRHGSRSRSRVQFQARKLAAGLWHLHYKEISSGNGGGRRVSQGEIRHRRRDRSRDDGGVEAEQRLQRRGCLDSSKKAIKIKAAAAEYWNPEAAEAAETAELGRFRSHRGGGEQPFTKASAASDVKQELAVAQTRICKLESQQRKSKKKIEYLKGKLEENRAMWKNRGHVKLDELCQEKETNHRTEVLNANLEKELGEAKENAKKYKQEYEKEKRNRELLEEVCAEMAKQIVGDKAKVEALKRESMKLCEEVEEERNMLQMAEVWREERIQMKLIDAKVALEDKYVQMNKLITDLENFLMSRSEKLDEMEMKRGELIHEAAKSVDIKEIEGFLYEPQKQSLVLSLLEDLKEATKLEEECEEINDNPVEKECIPERKTENAENPMEDSSKKKANGRFGNGRVWSEGGDLKGSDTATQRNSQNPHIKRGTHGCIEWPRGIQKNCFKNNTLDARIQTQKSQLRHVLKHK